MSNNIFPVAKFNKKFNQYLSSPVKQDTIYQSHGLIKHIEKRHPDCLSYFPLIPQIIAYPDYIGVNPNETDFSFELIKVIDNNIKLGIKLDTADDYLYVATLHTITNAKLEHGIKNGRLKKFDK